MYRIYLRILPLLIIFVAILACSASAPFTIEDSSTPAHEGYTQAVEKNLTESTPTSVYLPVVEKSNPVFFGYIGKVYWTKENVEKHMPEVDNLAGKKHTAVGWFIDIQDPAFYEDWETESALNRNNLYRQLERLWEKGYLSFIKIGSTDTAQSIIEGKYDNRLTQMAKIYLRWVQKGGGRKAMLAPLQEMNGDWVDYYSEGLSIGQKQDLYKQAYRKIQLVFEQNGVNRSMVWWVFAANGLSSPDVPENNFEYYYPGDEYIDLVGIASYNYGFCQATLNPLCLDGDCGRWETYDQLFEPYIRRLEAMAPGKPILITETGTSAIFRKEDRPDKYNYAEKSKWLIENYAYLASQPSVLGIFYFDLDEFDGTACDLKIPRGINFTGYRSAISHSAFQYLPVSELDKHIP
ncbi:MAG: glycosyl hydrolase [Chloroflexota bacterium]